MLFKDQFDAHIQGKSHAKKSRTPDEARDSLKENSTLSPETPSTASSSTLTTSELAPTSALERLASNSELRAALKEAEHFCNVCHVQCTSKVLGSDSFTEKFFLVICLG